MLMKLQGEALLRADELLDHASHDIAKYMAMTARNIDPETASSGEWTQLLEDLLRTDGKRPAWALWRPLFRELSTLARDEALGTIDRGMELLEELASKGDGEARIGNLLVSTTVEVADRIVALRRAVRRRRMEVDR